MGIKAKKDAALNKAYSMLNTILSAIYPLYGSA